MGNLDFATQTLEWCSQHHTGRSDWIISIAQCLKQNLIGKLLIQRHRTWIDLNYNYNYCKNSSTRPISRSQQFNEKLYIFYLNLSFRTENDDISDCLPCPAGMFCEKTGATEPTGPCKAGYICYGSAIFDDPIYNLDPGPDENNKTKIVVTFGDACAAGMSYGLPHFCFFNHLIQY